MSLSSFKYEEEKSLIAIGSGAESAPKGWRTPYIPSLLSVSVICLLGFVEWERRRERAGKSVLVPLSIFRAPRFGPLLGVVSSYGLGVI